MAEMNEKLQDSIPTVHRARQRRTTKSPTSLDECTRFTEWLINVTFNSSFKRYHYIIIFLSSFLPTLSLSPSPCLYPSISFKNLFYFLLYNNFSFFFCCSRIRHERRDVEFWLPMQCEISSLLFKYSPSIRQYKVTRRLS